MISKTTKQFWKFYNDLPEQIQAQADKAYVLWQENPQHPSLRFKCVDPEASIYSARISRQYRTLGVLYNETIVWFWIGKHEEYDKRLR